jgi:hypothetical protein
MLGWEVLRKNNTVVKKQHLLRKNNGVVKKQQKRFALRPEPRYNTYLHTKEHTMRYQVGFTYTVWVEVEADSESDALDKALEVEYDFQDTQNTGATLELNEFEDPIVHADE